MNSDYQVQSLVCWPLHYRTPVFWEMPTSADCFWIPTLFWSYTVKNFFRFSIFLLSENEFQITDDFYLSEFFFGSCYRKPALKIPKNGNFFFSYSRVYNESVIDKNEFRARIFTLPTLSWSETIFTLLNALIFSGIELKSPTWLRSAGKRYNHCAIWVFFGAL